jgi:hypothetical protein
VFRATRPVPHELCDLLVIFGDDVVVFSDKSIPFPEGELKVAWGRWYRRAVVESAKQLYGALREIRERPERLFADSKCRRKLRAPLPDRSRARYHLVAVAWGAADACKAYFGEGASSSLMVQSDLLGDDHFNQPFWIGRVDPKKPFVHVLDEASLQAVITEIDTAPDFIEYLKRRQALLTKPEWTITAAGEEEMLARYLTCLDAARKHDFLSQTETASTGHITFGEGIWKNYLRSSERQRKKEADKVSYKWDYLIKHLIDHTDPPDGDRNIIMHEQVFRIMAAENRFASRGLAKQLQGVIELSLGLAARKFRARVGLVNMDSEIAYIFLILKPDPAESDETNFNALANMLVNYCQVLCIERPEAKKIVGIGMFSPGASRTKETVCLMLNENLPEDFKAEIREMQQRLRILIDSRNRSEIDHQQEYPDEASETPG